MIKTKKNTTNNPIVKYYQSILKGSMNNSKLIYSTLIGLLGYWVIGLFFLPQPILADEVSLAISPPLIQIDVTPPAHVTTPITIQNLSQSSVNLDIVFKPFTAADSQDGQVKYFPNSQTMQGKNPHIFDSISIRTGETELKNVTLAPGQKRSLTLVVDLPEKELASDYYFSVVFISKNSSSSDNFAEESNLTRLPAGIATNVLLSIGPKGTGEAIIEEFSAPFFLNKGPVPFTVRLKNSSPHLIVPNGIIIITNLFGQPIGKVDLLPVPILAGTTRLIPDLAGIKIPSPSDSKRPKGVRAIWPESFLIGPYTATLHIRLSEKAPEYVRIIRFFAFPIQGVVGLLVILFIILIVRSRVKKRLSKEV